MPSPKEAFTRLRARLPPLDHVVRAFQRYQADTGDRLAAAVTFFGFLSFFPLLAVAASLLALLIGDEAIDTVVREVNDYAPGLAEQLGLETILRDNTRAGLTGLIGLVGLLYSGLGWVNALRQAVRTVMHHNVRAGNFLVTKGKDVVALVGLGLTVVVSVGLSTVVTTFTGAGVEQVGLAGSTVAQVTVWTVGTVLSLATGTGLFLYLFIRLPKVQTPVRRVAKGAFLAAVLFELLKRVGVLYVERTTENPVYGTFAVAVGLLVWINLVSRMLLFCAAWSVTAPYDSDVPPSGTSSPEAAREAGIPLRFADDDPDAAATVLADGAPTPLLAALQGKLPAQDLPEGRPGAQELAEVAARRATDLPPAPAPAAVTSGTPEAGRAASVGAGALGGGVAVGAVYALRAVIRRAAAARRRRRRVRTTSARREW